MAVTKSIKAKTKWNGTSVTVVPGTNWQVTVVSGTWTCNPSHGSYSGEGHSSHVAKKGYAFPGKPEGALVGKVGSDLFHIGNSGVIALAAGKPPGELLLTCNDDLDQLYGKGYTDNVGSLSVRIEAL